MYTIVKKPSMILVGIGCRTSNASTAAPYDIPKLWERFYSEDILSRIPSKVSSDIIAAQKNLGISMHLHRQS